MSVITPESVEFSYEVAGIGSRFIANLIDTFFQLVAISLVAGLIIATGLGHSLISHSFNLLSWTGALLIALGFAILWGYYIFFELVMNGQSPGKKAMGIRVMRDDGYPVTVAESMIRNLMRFVDFLPLYYGLAVVVMFFNGKSKRLGDFAAGTVVVREKNIPLPSLIVPLEVGKAPDLQVNIRLLSKDDYLLIREFMSRRNRLDLSKRKELSGRLARPLLGKLGLEELPPSIENDEAFLEALVSLYREREKSL